MTLKKKTLCTTIQPKGATHCKVGQSTTSMTSLLSSIPHLRSEPRCCMRAIGRALESILYVTGTSSRPLLRHDEIVRQPMGSRAQNLTNVLKYIK